jgi:DHA1 family multidrug resistance protein-like MFS transporter
LIFTINGALIILTQLRITTFLYRRCGGDLARQNRALATGNALLALGLVCFWWGTDHAWLWIAAIIVFTFGETIWSPLYDEMSVRLRTELSIPTALGFSGFLWGLAESAGAALGTSLALDRTAALSPFAVAALTSVVASLLFLGGAVGGGCRLDWMWRRAGFTASSQQSGAISRRSGGLPRPKQPYKTRLRMPSKLDPHVATIEAWLAAEP